MKLEEQEENYLAKGIIWDKFHSQLFADNK